MATLEDAILIATEAHRGQIDKAGESYILHPLRLMMNVKGETERMTAVLHDVVEDSEWTLDMLREKGFSSEVVEAVGCLTRNNDESYEEFIDRVRVNPIARKVKLADLKDNMDLSRLNVVTEKDNERLEKYRRAYSILTSD